MDFAVYSWYRTISFWDWHQEKFVARPFLWYLLLANFAYSLPVFATPLYIGQFITTRSGNVYFAILTSLPRSQVTSREGIFRQFKLAASPLRSCPEIISTTQDKPRKSTNSWSVAGSGQQSFISPIKTRQLLPDNSLISVLISAVGRRFNKFISGRVCERCYAVAQIVF